MTEYTTSSQALREYMTSRERTAYWVETNGEAEFFSPSAPPSVLDGWVPSSPVSEAESSHSEPPRMVLRYGNGVEVPIPNSGDSGSRSSGSRRRRDGSRSRSPASPIPPRSSSSHHRAMSGPHPNSSLAHSGSYGMSNQAPPAPEEIRVLPSADPQPSSSNLNQPRSRSVEHSVRHDPVPGSSINPRIRTPYPGATSPTARGPLPPLQVPAQPLAYAPQSSPWHSYSQARAPPHLHKQPPAIIYAPSNTTSRPHYLPPAIYHYPPQMGPNGMTYSHSAPAGSQYPRSSVTPATMLPPSYAFTQVREGEYRGATWNGHSNRGHDRSRSLPVVPPPLSRSSSSDSLNSGDSGSTYYVLPSAGQKIHVLPPSPQLSIGTATSTTRSAHSPHSPNKKTPLFKRLFGFAGKYSGGENRRIERRHSTSGVNR
ncbi:hypothetical protein C0995_011009 [Termitomyces sp. Mi166|nr:hypothetical protein C0995_011009 [Termitomyces sp. Mi166\